MDNSASLTAQGPDENSLTISYLLSALGPGGEHVAWLGCLSGLELLRRRDGLFDEGVAAVFGVAGGEAELVCLCFHGEEFTPADAKAWLAERGFRPLLIIPNSGRRPAGEHDAPPSSRVEPTPRGRGAEGEGR